MNDGISAQCFSQDYISAYSMTEHSLGGYDKAEEGFISLHASNGSLRADSQDQICVYL